MRSAWRPLICALLSAFCLLALTGCGLVVNDPSLFGGGDAAVSIAVTGPSTVMLGARSQYAAAVKGSSDASVTWSVNGVAGGNATIGSISSLGLYTAPVSAPQSSKVTITATSVASPSVSQSLPVALAAPPPPTVSTPVTLALNGADTVTLGAMSQYTATITGSANTDVTWSVDGVVGGNTSVGAISATGLYTAPATNSEVLEVTISATSAADPSVSQSMSVALGEPPTPPIISSGAGAVTVSLSGATSVTLGTTSQYTATVTGSSDTSVIWSVNGINGGSDAVGLISVNGLYTGPGVASASSTVIITATSVADPYVSQSLTIALSAPQAPSVTLDLTGPTVVTAGTTSQYTATVTGSSNTSVIWSVNGSIGGDSTVGTISTDGGYTAPMSVPASSAVTISATSAADPSVSMSLSVTFTAPPQSDPVTLVLTGPTTVELGASAHYSATVTGSSNTGVAWSINGVLGGNSTVGTISTKGHYTAPSVEPDSAQVTITATSKADPSVSQNLSVALSAPPASTGGSSSVALALSGPTTVTLGASAQYSAVVTGDSNTSVIWSINSAIGGNSTVGTISKSGKYTAPASEPPSSKVTITVTSVADPSVAQSLVVTLTAPAQASGGDPTVALALSGPTTVTLGTSTQYSAIVTGSSDTTVIWSVNGVTGGDSTVGTISTQGNYTAPTVEPNTPKVTITATSDADSSVSQSISVTLAAPTQPGGGEKVTLTLSGATSVTLGNTSQYVATVTGGTNTAVTWSVGGIEGGEESIGTISKKGLYTAPQTAPQPSKITITATSAADTSVSQSITVTLAVPAPTITLTLSGAKTVTLGTTSPYTATVTGSSNTGVTWSVNGIAGGNTVNGTISANGLYSAPSTIPQVSTVTIAATSVADSTIAKSMVVTLVAPTSTSRIPANAIASSDLDASTRWQWNHDAGTPGSSQGSTVYPVSGISSDNAAREFYMTYSSHGGEIYHVSFATDKQATHFIYDTYVYVVDPSQLQNLEMDMNDVTPDGKTMILGTQCSSISNSWEYTLVSGGHPHWHPSNIPCNPMKWSANTWHHIQIASHRDNSGNATYDWVGVDGQYTNFQNATGADALSLGWAIGDLLINFQIDGASKGSGSNTIYTDKLIVYRW
jgi:hypothetical protein